MMEASTFYIQGTENIKFDRPDLNCRLIHAGVKKHEWPRFIQDVFRILKPGVGWAQLSEYSGRAYENDIPPVDSYDWKV